jgi:hypothetical protein
MRLACDLDGVLADMESAIVEVAERLFGPEVDHGKQPAAAAGTLDSTLPADADAQQIAQTAHVPDAAATPLEKVAQSTTFRALTPRQQRTLWRKIGETDNFWESLDEIEQGSIARLAMLTRERRWEVIFITQRPDSAGDPTQVQTQRWLARHGFDFPSVYVIRGSRGKVAAALHLDVVIDDRPENCLDVVVDSKAQAILIWRGDENAPLVANARRLGIEVMASVMACLEKFAGDEDAANAAKPGLLERLKRKVTQ